VCLVAEKYKKARSFIKNGPLQLLKTTKEGSVLYIDYKQPYASIDAIRSAISKAASFGSKLQKIESIVQVHHFVLPCIYLLELAGSKVGTEELVQLVKFASGKEEPRARALATGALAILMRNREVEMTAGRGYKLSPLGLARFADLKRRGRRGRTVSEKAMDEMRVNILNWRYRGKRLAVK
jgi:hypothetical protein